MQRFDAFRMIWRRYNHVILLLVFLSASIVFILGSDISSPTHPWGRQLHQFPFEPGGSRSEVTRSLSGDIDKDDLESSSMLFKSGADIVHVIAPFPSEKDNPSYQYYAQPLAISSLDRARKFAKADNISVQIIIFGRESDYEYGSQFISSTIHVLQTRCGADITPPHLELPCVPLVKDFFDAAYNHSNANIVIYTNADIGVYENFYVRAFKAMKKVAAMSAERKNIPKASSNGIPYTPEDLDTIYKLKKITNFEHGGGDCFIFRKDAFSASDIDLGEMIVGSILWDGFLKLMLQKKHKSGFKYFRDKSKKMTWHQGNDWGWQTTTPSHSRANCWNVLNAIRIFDERPQLIGANTANHFTLRGNICKFGTHFQCRNYVSMFDYFFPSLDQRLEVGSSCIFNETLAPKQMCDANVMKFGDTNTIEGYIPCIGECLYKDQPISSFQKAWKGCSESLRCNILLRDPSGEFYLRRSSVSADSTYNAVWEGYSYTYVECAPELKEKLPHLQHYSAGIWPVSPLAKKYYHSRENA